MTVWWCPRVESFHVEECVCSDTFSWQNSVSLCPASFYRWSPDGQYWNQIDYILCSQRWRRSVQSAKTRAGADCGSDHELLIAKFRLKLKKVEKTFRPFSYNPKQIPYNYTVEVRNRFKGLDLIDRGPDELWTEVHDIVWEAGIKNILQKKKYKKINSCLRRPYKLVRKKRSERQRRKTERYTHQNAEFQRIARRGKKAFLVINVIT